MTAECGKCAGIEGDAEKFTRTDAGSSQDEGCQGDQDDEAHRRQQETKRQPEAGSTLGSFRRGRENCAIRVSVGGLVNGVEDAAIGEVLLLRLRPAAEVLDVHQLELGKARQIGRIGR